MKKTACLFLLISFSLNIFAQIRSQNDQFTLTGKITGQQTGYVSLEYTNNEGKSVKDSCVLKKGNFYFKGNISEPTLATLRGDVKSIADDDLNSISLYLEPRYMTAMGQYNHLKEIKITGSKTQIEYKMLQKKYDSLTKIIGTKSNQFDPSPEYYKIAYHFIIDHFSSYLSGYLLALHTSKWSLDSIKFIYNKLSPSIQKSFYGREVAETIDKIDSALPGKMAKEFTATNVNGKSIRLSDFKGKYVLLDFWASWCLPCRQGSPHLINLFKKYRGQGLEIIGVADDDSKPDAWRQAIIKDNVNIWYNVLNGRRADKNGEENNSESINDKYGIQVLPTKILIDKSGMIIGRYKGTESATTLDNKLSEIFK